MSGPGFGLHFDQVGLGQQSSDPPLVCQTTITIARWIARGHGSDATHAGYSARRGELGCAGWAALLSDGGMD